MLNLFLPPSSLFFDILKYKNKIFKVSLCDDGKYRQKQTSIPGKSNNNSLTEDDYITLIDDGGFITLSNDPEWIGPYSTK